MQVKRVLSPGEWCRKVKMYRQRQLDEFVKYEIELPNK